MDRQTFAGDDSTNRIRHQNAWTERLLVVALLAAGLLVFTINLGGVALRDWDEGTVAQVAREILQAPENSNRWLFPTLWEQPYLNKPPLIHDLIALCYRWGGVNETTARLPSALLMAVSVPFAYGLGKELFLMRQPALFSALIYLTTLPLVRHGRLAMLDGAVVCFTIVLMWSVLRSRRDLRWCLAIGISLSLIGLTKGIIALLLGGIAFGFIAWDTPRLFRSFYFWGGLLLGGLPVLSWYALQGVHYHGAFLETAVVSQSFSRFWRTVENNGGPPWYYLQRLLHFLPWVIFALSGLHLAWHNKIWSWSKLVLVWSGVYFLVITVMSTKLPWYILPLYPALALAGGKMLTEIFRSPREAPYPRDWGILLLFLGGVSLAASVYFGVSEEGNTELVIITLAVALTTGMSGALVLRRNPQFINILTWGMYVSLLLFFSSSQWLWELNEAYPVKPVAMLIRDQVPENAPIYTSFDYERPSLNFYAQKRVLPAKLEDLKYYWEKDAGTYLLVDPETLQKLSFREESREHYQAPPHWHLISHQKLN
ncbi:glycosyl transferase family 39 [Halothece sp. PCC 7418]|uniref:ArnT family glycosyltransferase n=1 Tax=Halothece sp. (strain PCC 7418) TaxID=65093 RepID=UPI0002A087C7|nr:glycosyltransferase family 39 protein [Halothece sp. PCC 7418]AFZ43204.1 glycosyl transferase family 39 [Halothece sp. PCC 7418]